MESIVIILLLIAVVVLLASEKVSYLGVSVLILSTLTISGILEPSETFANLADPTIMLYVGAFIISSAFIKVGLSDDLAQRVLPFLGRWKGREGTVLFAVCLLVSILTIFLQAFGVQVAMLTLILTLSSQLGIGKKKALLALGFSATIGSTFTLMGNNVNLLAKAAYEELSQGQGWSFFELSALTAPMGLAMMAVYCFLTSRWLKEEPETAVESRAVESAGPAEPRSRRKQGIVLAVTGLFFLAMFLDGKTPVPANVAVLICAAILVLGRVMTSEEALGSISWPIILFTVSVLSLSSCFMKVGAGEALSDLLVRLLGDQISLRAMVAIIFVVATLATQLLSNSGTFAICLPIVVNLALRLQLPVKPVIVALCLASSCAFLTPLSAPTFPLLATTGKISFREFLIQGIPLTAISAIVCIVWIPILWG